MTQMDLALDAEISTRHLSFVETGRAQPSREMVLHLCDRLEVPLRDRNTLLVAAGYAPVYAQRPLTDPALQHARAAVDLVLKGHEPYPALAIDRHWTLVNANRAVAPLLAGADALLLKPPVNVLRLSLHPDGVAPRIVNLGQCRRHLLERLKRQAAASADPVLAQLLAEVSAYPAPEDDGGDDEFGAIAIPLKIASDAGVLSLFSTIAVFGAPSDLTLAELALESFFPSDEATANILRGLAEQRAGTKARADG
jgi:transcriptional regulator with XRE-family HTH domain